MRLPLPWAALVATARRWAPVFVALAGAGATVAGLVAEVIAGPVVGGLLLAGALALGTARPVAPPSAPAPSSLSDDDRSLRLDRERAELRRELERLRRARR